MAAKSYSLTYDGYWRDKNRGGVPGESGVYSVYACTHNAQSGTVSLRMLIYIGQAENAKERLSNHEREKDWKKHLQSGEELCFSFAPVKAADRDRVEAALIHHHRPPENTEYVNSFPFDQTAITADGKNTLLCKSFTVYRRQ